MLGVPVSDVEYKSPTSKVFLGSKSKTCAAGEKKLLLLSHIDQMANQHRYKVWVTDKTAISFVDPDSPAYVGDGWANNVDSMSGYDLATDTENYGSGKATSTIYGSTPRYSNEGVDGEKEYRFDVFPDAIELCVPTATTELTMVIAAITEGWDFTFGEDGQDKLSDRKFIPSFTIMDEDGCLAAPALGIMNALTCTPHRAATQPIANRCPVPEQVTIFSTFARNGIQSGRQRKARGP